MATVRPIHTNLDILETAYLNFLNKSVSFSSTQNQWICSPKWHLFKTAPQSGLWTHPHKSSWANVSGFVRMKKLSEMWIIVIFDTFFLSSGWILYLSSVIFSWNTWLCTCVCSDICKKVASAFVCSYEVMYSGYLSWRMFAKIVIAIKHHNSNLSESNLNRLACVECVLLQDGWWAKPAPAKRFAHCSYAPSLNMQLQAESCHLLAAKESPQQTEAAWLMLWSPKLHRQLP